MTSDLAATTEDGALWQERCREAFKLIDAKDTVLLTVLAGLADLRDDLEATQRRTVHGQVFLNREIDAVDALLDLMR